MPDDILEIKKSIIQERIDQLRNERARIILEIDEIKASLHQVEGAVLVLEELLETGLDN